MIRSTIASKAESPCRNRHPQRLRRHLRKVVLDGIAYEPNEPPGGGGHTARILPNPQYDGESIPYNEQPKRGRLWGRPV